MSYAGVNRLNLELWLGSAILLGFVAVSALAAWVYLVLPGGTFGVIQATSLVLWVVSIVMVVVRRRVLRRAVDTGLLTVMWTIPLVLVLVLLVYVVPRGSVQGEQTPMIRIGPDAIGYVNATDAFMSNNSFQLLRKQVFDDARVSSESELFSRVDFPIYTMNSKELSVKAEFIVGAKRICFPLMAALVASASGGRTEIFSALSAVTLATFLTSALIVLGLLKLRGMSTFRALLLATTIVINVNLVHFFHEGGLAHGWASMAVAGIVALFVVDSTSLRLGTMLFVAGITLLLTAYSDPIVVLSLGVCVWIATGLGRGGLLGSDRAVFRSLVVGSGVAALLAGPLTLEFVSSLRERFTAAQQWGGWWQPKWIDLSAAVGLIDIYSDRYSEFRVVPERGFLPGPIMQLLLGVILYVYWRYSNLGQLVKTRSWYSAEIRGRSTQRFLFSIVGAVAAVYFVSRFVVQSNNYSYSKTIAVFVPVIFPLFFVNRLCNRDDGDQNRRLENLLLCLFTVFAFLTANGYLATLRREATYIDRQEILALNKPDTRRLLTNYQMLALRNTQLVEGIDNYMANAILTPYWPGRLVNGGNVVLQPVSIDRDLKIGMLVTAATCGGLACVSKMAPKHYRQITPNMLLIDVGINGDALESAPPEQWNIIVNRALATRNGPLFGTDFTRILP